MILKGHLLSTVFLLGSLCLLLGFHPDAKEPLVSTPGATDRLPATPTETWLPLPTLETYADTVAMRVFEAAGGEAAWQALPYLGFNFSVSRQNERGRVVRHFWNRQTGDYRLEMPGPANIPYVTLFNINTREGRVYWQGTELDTVETAKRLPEAYHRFINDTYWLTVPYKLFDPGVNRTYEPDMSDDTYDVIRLTFGNVGLTPGDRYWLYVDKETGRLAQWAYILQDDGPDAKPRMFVWDQYEEHVTPAGSLFYATRKRGVGVPFAIYTDDIATPTVEQVPDDMFTAIEARLTPENPNADPFEAAPPIPGRTRSKN